MSKITTFHVIQKMEVHSNDCHTVEQFAMSHFGTTDLPDHVQVEVVGVTDHEQVDEQVNETKAEDGQAPEPAAQ